MTGRVDLCRQEQYYYHICDRAMHLVFHIGNNKEREAQYSCLQRAAPLR